jgi:hypothetical protein
LKLVSDHNICASEVQFMLHVRIIGLSVVLLALVAPVHSQFVPAGLSPFEQASRADLIVVGKVTDIESQPVVAAPVKGAGKVGHIVASIHIEENLLGAKGLTHVRVGFVPEIPALARDPAVPFLG